MRVRIRPLLLAALALHLATTAQPISAQDCANTCSKAKTNVTQFLLGAVQDFGVDTVTVYMDEDAWKSDHFTASMVNAALAKLKTRDQGGNTIGTCKDAQYLPPFVLAERGAQLPDGWNSVPQARHVVHIDFVPGKEAGEVDVDNDGVLDGYHPASIRGNEITVAERCPSGSHHGMDCFGNGFIRWSGGWGRDAMVHELLHYAGLKHDDSGCSQDTVMSKLRSWSDPNLPLLPAHCELASRINNTTAMCNNIKVSNDESHPCELCRYTLGGTVEGLMAGETTQIKARVSLSGQSQTLTTGAGGSGNFDFSGTVANTSTYEIVEISPSNPNKHCTVTNGTGVISDADVTDIEISCHCMAGTTSPCDDPDRGELFDPDPEVRVVQESCEDYPLLCSGGGTSLPGPWWWARNPPDISCDQDPICVSTIDCSGQLNDGSEGCSEQVECHDYCGGSPTTTSVFGPLLGTDGGTGPLPASGQLRLTGLARDRDGVQGMLFFLDGVKLAPTSFRHGLYRTDACQGSQGDCDPYSGFEAVFDTTAWSDGEHRLDVIAVDDAPVQPMGTRIHRTMSVDNACAATAAPTVSLTAPADGAIVAGSVPVTASASAEAGVERVQFYLDGARVSSDWTAPYTWSWDSTAVPDGSHTLGARVVDECGARIDAAPVSVETANANDPPALELEVPTVGVAVAGSAVEVSGWALDEDGIDSVVLRLDGVPVSVTGSESRDRTDVCSAFGDLDPDCPEVGWALTFDSTAHPDRGYTLQVVATDRRGGETSVGRQIEIRNDPPLPPTVTAPVSRTALLGGSVTFDVAASGTDPLTYRWQHREGTRWVNLYDGTRVTGANTDTLTLDLLEYADAGGYRCRVSNGGGSTASTSASLSVVESIDAPTVTPGLDQAVTEGETATLRVSAEGVGPLTYRWQHLEDGTYVDLSNGGGFSGVRSDTLTLSGTTLADEGYYRCRVSNDGGTTPSAPIRLTVHADLGGTCVEGPNTICLHQNRFRAEMVINGSAGKAHDYSDVGGLFTLSNPDNVEAAVKILDGTGVNGRYWVFHGALTDLAYTLTVTDTVTGAERTYLKQSGSFCGTADTTAFSDPSDSTGSILAGPFPAVTAASTASCTSGSTALCLLDSRFRVQVLRGGIAQRAVPATSLSGVFTFGSSANPEVVVKVLDGTPVNDWYWVFFGSLTDQDYEVVVTDTGTGAEKRYPSPGPSCGDADTTAF